jgi:adenine-specific DNA-methyltransferase
MSSRGQVLQQIAGALNGSVSFSSSDAVVAKGDSLDLLRSIPSESVNLILTDPPYHATKKRNIHGDTSFASDDDYLKWMSLYAAEWRRVLRLNGSLYCFCDSSMASRLDAILCPSFNILSHIVWTKPNEPGFDGWKGKMKKEALRQWYPHSERILFAEPAADGNLFRSPFALFLKKTRLQAGLTMHQLTAATGAFGKVNHGGAVSNWEEGRNTPSKEQYEKMCAALEATGNVDSMPPYEDVIRPFQMSSDKQFTDVWDYPSVRPYRGKHPAEKPLVMLEHIINASSFPGDIVLDCFGGSGNTGLAALQLGRRAVLMEIDQKWVEASCWKLQRARVTTEYNYHKTLVRSASAARSTSKTLYQQNLISVVR